MSQPSENVNSNVKWHQRVGLRRTRLEYFMTLRIKKKNQWVMDLRLKKRGHAICCVNRRTTTKRRNAEGGYVLEVIRKLYVR